MKVSKKIQRRLEIRQKAVIAAREIAKQRRPGVDPAAAFRMPGSRNPKKTGA